MRRKVQLSVLILLILCVSLGAQEEPEGNFQINSVFHTASFPLFGSGGQDILRYSGVGIALKSTRGMGLHGMIDLAIIFPYVYEEKIYPAASFSAKSMANTPFALDGIVGLAYAFDLEPMVILLSAGFHSGLLIDGIKTLAAFGLGLDAQSSVKMGKVLTAQVGVRFSVDFAGTQSFSSGSNQFAGFPLGLGFYTGVGLNY